MQFFLLFPIVALYYYCYSKYVKRAVLFFALCLSAFSAAFSWVRRYNSRLPLQEMLQWCYRFHSSAIKTQALVVFQVSQEQQVRQSRATSAEDFKAGKRSITRHYARLLQGSRQVPDSLEFRRLLSANFLQGYALDQ